MGVKKIFLSKIPRSVWILFAIIIVVSAVTAFYTIPTYKSIDRKMYNLGLEIGQLQSKVKEFFRKIDESDRKLYE